MSEGPSAEAIIERACARHGGAVWERLEAIELHVESLQGFVPWSKGHKRTFPPFGFARVEPKARRMIAYDWPEKGQATVFDRGAVKTVALDEAKLGFEGPDHRKRFSGFAKLSRWTPEDAVYFFGYAVTHYLGLPFSLKEARIAGAGAVGERTWVDAQYTPEQHTHCGSERFYFEPDGLLYRHDYTADVIGPGTAGAHFSADYEVLNGFPVARDRRVVARLGRALTPIPVLQARLVPQAVVLKG